MAIRAAFLDRDGVINEKAPGDGYVTKWEDMHILPNVPEAICLLNRAGLRVIIVSNQRCVAKGLLSEPDLEVLHARLTNELRNSGANIDAIYYCPHEAIPPCDCRKPAPGMLLRAAKEHDINLRTSWMIGDKQIDIQAGINAGCRTAAVTTSEHNWLDDVRGDSLLAVVRHILA